MKLLFKIFIFIVIGISVAGIKGLYDIYFTKNSNNQEAIIKKEELGQILKEQILFIKNSNYSIQNNHINYTLSLDNHIVSFEIKDKSLISFIEFDYNRMSSEIKDEVTKIYSTTYEVIPSNYKIRIYFNDGSVDDYDINVRYFYKADLTINKYVKGNWIFSPQGKYDTTSDGITLLGQYENHQPTTMQYYKDFNRDITLRFDFEVLKDVVTDLKLSFGERLFFSFNNKRIDIYRREYSKKLNKNVWVRYYFIKDFSRLKKGVKYTIYLKRFKENSYSLEFIDHSNNVKNRKKIYTDDGKNHIEFEKFKNLRILLGSKEMKIIIKEIELN